MSTPILATKLYVPPSHARGVARSRLIERLNEGLQRKLTLISAPAGFGKTTLISDWIAGSERPGEQTVIDYALLECCLAAMGHAGAGLLAW